MHPLRENALQKIRKDKKHLVNAYSSSVTRYYGAVNALVNHDSIEDRDKFEEVYRAVDVAQTASAKAHQELHDHRAEHGC